jgi:hypothetical protein
MVNVPPRSKSKLPNMEPFLENQVFSPAVLMWVGLLAM